MNPEDLELLAEAELGEEARKFLESDLGLCLVGLAKQDAEEAKDKLSTVDPEDKLAIVRLQREIAFGNRFEQYLRELLHRGNEAFEVLQEKRETR